MDIGESHLEADE